MQKIYSLILILFTTLSINAQQATYNPYFPIDNSSKDWNFAAHTFYDNHNNSNSLTNEFSFALNNSKYIDEELKDRQMSKLDGSILIGRIFRGGFGVWLNSKKTKNTCFYIGMDFQEVLDGQVDPNFVGVLMYGNKRYAGENLHISNTEYTNTYFNRLKFGMGKTFGDNQIKHTISGLLGFTIGQNHDYLNVQSADIYTQIDGDYLDMAIQAETQLADTVWGDLFTVNGLGASADLRYSMYKEKDFFLAININNLGFVNWNGSPFTASSDTNFRFEGIENDSASNNQIPNNFSQDNLRDLIFKNPSSSSFTQILPFDINITAGKYFSNGKFYVGINSTFYPTLIAAYRAELFATWNIKDKFQLSPIIGYSSYQKVNIGLSVGVQLWESLYLRAGSSYLNSMFNTDAPAGQGGFISVVFVK